MGRRDGKLLKDIDSMHFIMPIIYPNRCDNEAYFNELIDLTNLDKYLEEKNKDKPESTEEKTSEDKKKKSKKERKPGAHKEFITNKPKETQIEKPSEKKYEQPPIIAHDSELPSMTFEEINNGRLIASPHDLNIEEEKEEQPKIQEKEEEPKDKTKTKKEKKYIQPPIIAHDSELPQMLFEEINTGKLVASPHDLHFDEEKPIKDTKDKKEEIKQSEEPKDKTQKGKKPFYKKLVKNIAKGLVQDKKPLNIDMNETKEESKEEPQEQIKEETKPKDEHIESDSQPLTQDKKSEEE